MAFSSVKRLGNSCTRHDMVHTFRETPVCWGKEKKTVTSLRLLFSLKPKENGQNEIVSNMDRSEVKLSISEKNIVISHIQNEILKQKNLTGSEFEGAPKLLKAFFSRLFLCQNYETLEVPTRAVFHPLVCNLVVL